MTAPLRCPCGRPVPVSSRDGVHCAEHDLPASGVLADYWWRHTLAAGQHWCRTCREYRVERAGDQCPICRDEERRAS